MQMIGHEENQSAVPDGGGMIVRYGGKDLVSRSRTAEVIMVARFTIDGDEERTAFGDPLRNGVRETFADRTIHGWRVAGKKIARKVFPRVFDRLVGWFWIEGEGEVWLRTRRNVEAKVFAPTARWDSGPYLGDCLHFVLAKGGERGHLFRFSN
jgi:hypothetical protein